MSTKKYSVLNLVNCILLALTLTFSVISYAWYSPAEELGTPLSFSAGDTSNAITVTKLQLSDVSLDQPTPTVTVTDSGTRIGDEGFAATVLNFGTIDDLGVLKNSNVVYYCLTIPVAAGTDSYVNLAYDTSLLAESVELDENTSGPLHFNLYDEEEVTVDGVTTNSYVLLQHEDIDEETVYFHGAAKAEEVFEDYTNDKKETVRTFLAYSCNVSNVPPSTITADQLLGLFAASEGKEAPAKNSVSSTTYEPQNNTNEVVNVDPSAATDGYYYVYIKIYPDLDNYHELAQLLMDHMPFYVAFGLNLYVDVRPTVATASEETQS